MQNHDPASLDSGWWALDGITYKAWDNTYLYSNADRVLDDVAHRIYESLSGGTRTTVTMTIASPCVVTWAAHGLASNTPIVFLTTGALPTGLTAGTIYYIIAPLTNSFNVAATPSGSAINTSGSQSGVHTAVASPNKNKNLTDPLFWLDIGPSNKYAMFDSLNGTVTAHPYQIDVSQSYTGRVDSLALLNVSNAVSARDIMSTINDGVVFDETFSMISTAGIDDWFSYFFDDVERKDTLLVTALPAYANTTIRVIIEGNGTSQVQAGHLSIGLAKDLGETQHDGAQIGIIDYSRKDVDDFGNYTLVQRPFSRRGHFQCRIPKAAVDGVEATLSQHRATPAVYVATNDYGSTLIFGFFREFTIDIDYPLESLVTIEIEGLT
jgi:hypothetical protein